MALIPTADSLITGPSVEPLDLEEVKKHLRFGSTTEDSLIDAWISAARQYFEDQTGRQLITATWEYWLDQFPGDGEIELPHPPLQPQADGPPATGVVSVKYRDTSGVLQTWAASNYVVVAPQGPQASRGRVTLADGITWPSTQPIAGAVQIRYTAGYGRAAGDVPELIRTALYMLVGHFHRHRADSTEAALSRLPLGASTLIGSFKARPTRRAAA